MNCKLDSINLFKGYTQEENASTHAFLAFLNFLLHVDRRAFVAFLQSMPFPRVTIEPADIGIDCLAYNHGTWDGQIYSKKARWFIAIESKIKKSALSRTQLQRHKVRMAELTSRYDHVHFVFLTPFDPDWLVHEYLHGKREKQTSFVSWGEVYKAVDAIYGKLGGPAQSFVIEQYKKYLEAANGNRAGIIQIVSREFIDDDYIRKVKNGRYNMFHIPKKMLGFDVPNFRVFVYDREKGGVFSYFTSKGMFLNRLRSRERSFKHYFEIDEFCELSAPIASDDIRRLLGQKEMGYGYQTYKNFKTASCPAPYYVLNAEMVTALEQEAKKRRE